jgi:hypothetical protein
MFAIGNRKEAPDCLVEQSVNAALEATFAEAEALLLKRFSEITLTNLAADIARRHARFTTQKELRMRQDVNVIGVSYAGLPPPRNSCGRADHRCDRRVASHRRTRRALGQVGPPLPLLPRLRDRPGLHRHRRIGPMSIYQAKLLTGWGEVVELSGDARSTWQHPGVTVKETPTDRIDGHAEVVGKGAMAGLQLHRSLLWPEIVHPLQLEATTA